MFLHTSLDQLLVGFLAALAIWILVSGLDDLLIDLVYFLGRPNRLPWPSKAQLTGAPQRRLAILLPLWQEHDVVEQMLRHNLAAIRYGNYDFFVGVYPNDASTREAVEKVMRDDGRVHLARCPHDGPTSKGDCLNWAYRGMVEYEARSGTDFEIVVTHDAEDLIHPESIHLINWFLRDHQMAQVPVVALRTSVREWTHGLYCDEFAEFQFKDIPVRHKLGGFLPSNGVGTGFDRSALESLRRQHRGFIFDPQCLTEDYENGFRVHAAGFRQIFIPIHFQAGEPIATREYFPRGSAPAIRQRSRWVAGIALQGWQHHGWRGSFGQVYWFWRDRKGLIGNLLSPVANILAVGWSASVFTGWRFVPHVPSWLLTIGCATAALSAFQTAFRMHFSARLYGLRFAMAAPIRMLWGNWINYAATLRALRQFFTAQWRGSSLAWHKTAHAYPRNLAAIATRPRLGEVLVRLHFITLTELEEALQHKPQEARIGEYLVQRRKITSDDLSQALNTQSELPLGR